MNQEFRLKKIDEIRNYLIEEINRNELMSKKHKKDCRVFDYIEHSPVVISAISVFASIDEIPIDIASSAKGLKICVITAGSKNYKSINKKHKRRHDKKILIAKYELHSMQWWNLTF